MTTTTTKQADHPPAGATTPSQRTGVAWSIAGIAFGVFAGAIAIFARNNPAVGVLGITFVSIVLEALPFVLLGALLGGFIEVFVSRERISSLLPRNRTLATLVAGCLGLVFPVCECAIVPVTRRLVRKGVPFSVAIAYLLAGPIFNPIVASSTWVAYSGDVMIVATRLVCGFAVAVFVALLMDEFFPGQRALLSSAGGQAIPDVAGAPCTCEHDHDHCDTAAPPTVPLRQRIRHAFEHAGDEFLHVSQFLIVGAFVAALSQTLISRQAFVTLADSPPASIALMMGLAVVLNLCSEADAFVAASFRYLLPQSAQLAFMVLGPMLDLKLIAMYTSFVRPRAILLLVTLLCVVVFAMMMTLELLAVEGPA